MEGFLWTSFIFLLAAVLAVPVSKRLGFGSVLGYLIAGILIGPSCFALITKVEDILHFSEFGVVLLLFLIGLELEPKKLWQMRMPIFGVGGAQVLLCFSAFSLFSLSFGFSLNFSLLLGMGFSLSSTAMVLQVLQERKKLTLESGKHAFSILLFQDMAVIPMIALLPLLAIKSDMANASGPSLKFVGIFLAILFGGRFFLRYVLRWIASVHLREVFTALSLFLVVGMSALMHELGVSMGLGAFLAGLLLADSEYRHALEADIEPFKGLLLGLFFISVGMSVDLQQVVAKPTMVFGAFLGLLLVKTILHFVIGKAFRLPSNEIPFFALVLAQVGEFAFVLFGAAQVLGVISEEERGILLAVSAVSMLGTPLVLKLYDVFLSPLLDHPHKKPSDEIQGEGAPVIIAGFGRVGQIVGRFLFANGIRATVLDHEPDQIELLRKFGFKVFYGDATRLDLLEAAGAATAKILVVAIDDVEANLRLVDLARSHFPGLKIICRARNVGHAFELNSRGVEIWERETFDSSLRLGRHVLESLGFQRHLAFVLAQKFRTFDQRLLGRLSGERENERIRISMAQQARQDIETMFAEEEKRLGRGDQGWGDYDTSTRS